MTKLPDGRSGSDRRSLRRAFLVSLILFMACLVPHDFCKADECSRGWVTLLLGPLGFLYAPLSTLPWLANPLLAVAWLGCLAGNRRWSLSCGLAAFALAGGFPWHRRLVTDEGGMPSLVTWIAPGYWLWLTSIIVVAFAASRLPSTDMD